MVNKGTYRRIGIPGFTSAALAGSWGFVVAIASALPWMGDGDVAGFTAWFCRSHEAGWLYIGPMVLLPMAAITWIARGRERRWELPLALLCSVAVTAFVPFALARLW